jgi:hypothetical protein
VRPALFRDRNFTAGVLFVAVIGLTFYASLALQPPYLQDLVVVVGIIQGVGLGLLFTPLSVVSLSTLSSAVCAEGAGLYNLSRNVGSRIGISIVGARPAHAQHPGQPCRHRAARHRGQPPVRQSGHPARLESARRDPAAGRFQRPPQAGRPRAHDRSGVGRMAVVQTIAACRENFVDCGNSPRLSP